MARGLWVWENGYGGIGMGDEYGRMARREWVWGNGYGLTRAFGVSRRESLEASPLQYERRFLLRLSEFKGHAFPTLTEPSPAPPTS